jgi:hypothetical protein
MNRIPALSCAVILSTVTVACNRPTRAMQEYASETYIPVPGAVAFDIKSVPSTEGYGWLATYQGQGKTAKFRIELSKARGADDKESRGFDIKSGTGRFVAEPGSDASALLNDLKTALEAKSPPAKVRRMNALPFTFVSFGSNQSQSSDGGFFAKPPGNWTPMKIFIGEGDQEGEIFLNLNPVLAKGQFSIKDPDYGDIVLRQLASVL